MTDKPDNPPAFPAEGGVDSGLHPAPGMSLRDYFAAAALTGLVVSNRMDCVTGNQHPDGYAEDAYCIADAMLGERAKP